MFCNVNVYMYMYRSDVSMQAYLIWHTMHTG